MPLHQCGNSLPNPELEVAGAQLPSALVPILLSLLLYCLSGAFKNKPMAHSFATEREPEAHRRALSCTAGGGGLGIEPS